MYRLPALSALRAFEAAARHLSFKLAAEELHVTPAAISQQVKALEDHLGMPLFRRLTRALELTDAGRAMLPRLQEGFRCLQDALERTRESAEAGPLNVVAPPNFAARWLLPRLNSFTETYPDIELRLSSSAAAIDERPRTRRAGSMQPGEDTFDVEIRFGTGRYLGTRVDRIFGVAYVAVCSPRLANGPRPLRHPEDLKHHVLIHDDTIPDLVDRPRWNEWLQAAGVTGVDGERGPRFSNSGLALEAAMDGLGFALALQPLADVDVAAGRLAIPFDITLPSRYAYYLVSPLSAADRPVVRAFRDWLLAQAATMEPAGPPTAQKAPRNTA